MMKQLLVGAAALAIAGGTYLTAQAVTTPDQRLPAVNTPLTVRPAAATGTATGQATSTPTPQTPSSHDVCDDDAPGQDRHGGRGSSEYDDCTGLETVMPSVHDLNDDHSQHSEPGDDHGGHGNEPGDDHGQHSEPGDDHGGHGNQTGDDHGGGSETGDDHGGGSEGGDDHGGGSEGGDDHGGGSEGRDDHGGDS